MHTIPNDVGANFVQIPVIFFALFVPAACKRRYCDRRERMGAIWAADFWRLVSCNCASLATLILIATNFDGNDCVNFYTVVTIDMCLGIFVEMSIISLLQADNYALGYYGPHPGDFKSKARQGLLATTIAICCRCVSGMASIALFPLVNGTLKSHDDLMWGHGWAFTAIATPSIYHFTRLFCFDNGRPIKRCRTQDRIPLANSDSFSVGGDSDEEDDRDDTQNTNGATDKKNGHSREPEDADEHGEETAF